MTGMQLSLHGGLEKVLERLLTFLALASQS